MEYVNSLDHHNRIIALENIFPSDWMDEDEKVVSFYPCGKISSDFQDRIRVFDIAHYGITLLTFANLNHQRFLSTALGNMPVYFGEEEIKELEKTKNPTAAVSREINQSKVIEIHVNTNKDYLGGFGIEPAYINLEEVLKGLKKEFILVPEMREAPGCDYVNTPKQREMINYLRSLF